MRELTAGSFLVLQKPLLPILTRRNIQKFVCLVGRRKSRQNTGSGPLNQPFLFHFTPEKPKAKTDLYVVHTSLVKFVNANKLKRLGLLTRERCGFFRNYPLKQSVNEGKRMNARKEAVNAKVRMRLQTQKDLTSFLISSTMFFVTATFV